MNPQYSRYYTYVKPIVTNPYVKTYSTLIFSLIAITFFSLFAIRPTIKTILGLQKSIEEQGQILNQLTQKSQNLEAGRRNLDSIDPRIQSRIDSLLPSKTQVPKFIDQLTLLALQNQASISGLQFQPIEIDNLNTTSAPLPSLAEVSFTFNAQGQYSQLLNLLDSINNIDRLISIDTVGMSKLEQGEILMSVNGKAHFIK